MSASIDTGVTDSIAAHRTTGTTRVLDRFPARDAVGLGEIGRSLRILF